MNHNFNDIRRKLITTGNPRDAGRIDEDRINIGRPDMGKDDKLVAVDANPSLRQPHVRQKPDVRRGGPIS